jgi:hypothetical protein
VEPIIPPPKPRHGWADLLRGQTDALPAKGVFVSQRIASSGASERSCQRSTRSGQTPRNSAKWSGRNSTEMEAVRHGQSGDVRAQAPSRTCGRSRGFRAGDGERRCCALRRATAEAAEGLQRALDEHDRAVADADAAAHAETAKATTARAEERKRALPAFDDAMRREFKSPDTHVVGTPSGVLELRSGRTLLAGVVPQGPGLWRVDTSGGAVFVPGEPQARRLLWATLDDEVAVA